MPSALHLPSGVGGETNPTSKATVMPTINSEMKIDSAS
jgi:hypothetical protein